MDAAERTEKVSELAVQAKTDPSVILTLWGMVERLIRVVCRKYCRPDAGTRLYDFEDLCQSSYIAFLKAVDTYDPERGSFSNFLIYHIRKSCSKEIGRYSGKRDPLFDAGSISAPQVHGDDDFTLADTLEDTDAWESFDVIERDMVVDTILAEADRLPNPKQGRVIREHTYLGRPLDELAAEMGISKQGAASIEERAIFLLRRRPILRELYAEYRAEMRESIHESAASPYRKKSAQSFQTDFTSIVEDIVMRLEQDGE